VRERIAALKPLLIVFVIALLARGGMAPLFPAPRVWDSTYYYLLAENLARGRGLAVDLILHFQDRPQTLPWPAGAIWLPGQALVEAAAMKLFGLSFRGAQAAVVVLAALATVLCYQFAREVSHNKRTHVLAVIFSLASGSMAVNFVDTDCYTLYGLAGALALYGMVRWSGGQMVAWSGGQLVRWSKDHQTNRPSDHQTSRPIWLASVGLWIGIAHWTRQDAPLLWAVLLCSLLFWRRQSRQGDRETRGRGDHFPCLPVTVSPCLLVTLCLYLAIVAPMYLRNLRVWGRLSPVDPLYPALLTDYAGFFALHPQRDLGRFLAQGWGDILADRWQALKATFTAVVARASFQYWQLPFLCLGAWAVRRRKELFPVLIYPLLLWLALGIVYPFPAMHGTFLHSFSAFLPFGYALAALGVEEAGRLLGRARGIRAAPMTRYLRGLTAVAAVAVTVAVTLHARGEALEAQETCSWLGGVFASLPAEARVMSPNPPLVTYCTRRPGVVVPELEEAGKGVMLEAMERFGVDYLVAWGEVAKRVEHLNPGPLRLVAEGRGIRIWRREEGHAQEERVLG